MTNGYRDQISPTYLLAAYECNNMLFYFILFSESVVGRESLYRFMVNLTVASNEL